MLWCSDTRDGAIVYAKWTKNWRFAAATGTIHLSAGYNFMAPTIQELGLDRRTPEDRLTVAEAIWDSVSQDVQNAPLTPAQRTELEHRLADSIADPSAVTPWEVIRDRARARPTKRDRL